MKGAADKSDVICRPASTARLGDYDNTYTILTPQMSPIHFDMLIPALAAAGYHMVQLPTGGDELDYGLKYVNNDACYPVDRAGHFFIGSCFVHDAHEQITVDERGDCAG